MWMALRYTLIVSCTTASHFKTLSQLVWRFMILWFELSRLQHVQTPTVINFPPYNIITIMYIPMSLCWHCDNHVLKYKCSATWYCVYIAIHINCWVDFHLILLQNYFLGREIRDCLDEHVAQLYSDLDGGFSHLAWLLPGWLPLPSFR